MSRIFERILENDIDTANDHLPARKRSLAELLKEEKPDYQTRGGEVSRFLVEELQILAKEIPPEYHGTFMIPIVILRRMDLGAGIYTVAGSKMELFLIYKLLSQDTLQWTDFPKWQPTDRLARPQAQLIRRKLSSATCLGFTTGLGK